MSGRRSRPELRLRRYLRNFVVEVRRFRIGSNQDVGHARSRVDRRRAGIRRRLPPAKTNHCDPSTGLVASIMALSLSFGEVSAAATHPAVSPYQEFSNPILQVHAPDSDGWSGITQTPDRIAFGKSGSTAGESFVAAVVLFRIPEFPNSEAFTEYIREGVIKDLPSDRFEATDSNIQYSSERGYPCVRYHAIAIDRKARTSVFVTKKLRLEDFALYCQHPTKPGLGFSVSFSHRGGDADEKIDAEAAAFMDSVQVTSPAKAP